MVAAGLKRAEDRAKELEEDKLELEQMVTQQRSDLDSLESAINRLQRDSQALPVDVGWKWRGCSAAPLCLPGMTWGQAAGGGAEQPPCPGGQHELRLCLVSHGVLATEFLRVKGI